jgi:hypothetical protein
MESLLYKVLNKIVSIPLNRTKRGAGLDKNCWSWTRIACRLKAMVIAVITNIVINVQNEGREQGTMFF